MIRRISSHGTPAHMLRILGRIIELEEKGEFSAALHVLEQYLDERGNLPEEWRSRLETKRALLSRLCDPNYSPPAFPAPEHYEPLRKLSRAALNRGDIAEALRKEWEYVQYLSVGTRSLQYALSDLAELALASGYERLAKAFAHLFVAHLEFRNALSGSALNLVVFEREDEYAYLSPEDVIPAGPAQVALRFIGEEDDPDWFTILERCLEEAEVFRRKAEELQGVREPFFENRSLNLMKVLVSAYLKHGRTQRLEGFLQKHPEASRFLSEHGDI
jgi:hypothetical protein